MIVLSDGHRRDLEASGLTVDTILTAGLYSGSEIQVRALLGHGVGPGLVFPYPAFDGPGFTDYAIVKPTVPPDPKRKYLLPRKRGNRIYVPPEPLFPRAILTDVRTTLLITEGMKKSLAGCQRGLYCLGLAGVWNWRGKRSPEARQSLPLEELDRIDWRGRLVWIVFDSDIMVKPGVAAAARALGHELARRGALAIEVRLPPGPNGTKAGLDDFLLIHPVQDLSALALRAAVTLCTKDDAASARRIPLHRPHLPTRQDRPGAEQWSTW